MPTITSKPVCHERRHMSPSLFMTYDAIRAMCESGMTPANKKNPFAERIFHGRLTTLTNHTSLSRNRNRDNIASLIATGWMIPEARNRFRGGKFGTNRYALLTHEQYEQRVLKHDEPLYKRCPDFKYEYSTGKLLRPSNKQPKGFYAQAMQQQCNGNAATTSSGLDTDGVQRAGRVPRPETESTTSSGLDTSL